MSPLAPSRPSSLTAMVSSSVCRCVLGNNISLYVDTERLYSRVGQQIIDRHSLLTDPAAKQLTGPFKGQLMGRKKRECSRMMVEQFQLDMSVDEYIDLSFRMEVYIPIGHEVTIPSLGGDLQVMRDDERCP